MAQCSHRSSCCFSQSGASHEGSRAAGDEFGKPESDSDCGAWCVLGVWAMVPSGLGLCFVA
jgi:hypothetical protein